MGCEILNQLSDRPDIETRILVREDSNYHILEEIASETFVGDLLDTSSILPAVRGCDAIISTANAVIPRHKNDTLENVDIKGHKTLIDIANKEGVRQFIYTSALMSVENRKPIPLESAEKAIENYLKTSGIPYTIFRPVAFMVTKLPLKGVKSASINRPFPFMEKFYKGIANDIDKGKINIIGKGYVKHSFISIKKVAEFICKSLFRNEVMNKTYDLGGPASLSSLEAKSIFKNLLGKELKIKRTPVFVMKLMGSTNK